MAYFLEHGKKLLEPLSNQAGFTVGGVEYAKFAQSARIRYKSNIYDQECSAFVKASAWSARKNNVQR